MLDHIEDERQRREYEARDAIDTARELERYKRAVDMCVAAGYLDRGKFQEALKFLEGR